MTVRHRLRDAIDAATAALTEAGVDSARIDAMELAAHAAGIDRGRLALLDSPGEEFFERFDDLVAARRRRVPLQHLTGVAAFGPVTVHVGPGVFIPRPETESVLEWAVAQRRTPPSRQIRPLVVELCTGSGALALALAHRWSDARIVAVDDSDAALEYARRNLAGTSVELLRGDVTDPGLLPEFDGQVDLVVANPPYIPDGAVLEPEVAEHDPAHALFGGPDGMAVIEAIVGLADRWLTAGGSCAVEHDDSTSAHTVAAFTRTGRFTDVTAHRDVGGRDRFVTATKRTRHRRSPSAGGSLR